MKLIGTQKIEIDVSRDELAKALQQIVIEDCFENDLDKLSHWSTEGFYVYADNTLIATDNEVASIVNTINILKNGSIRTYKG